MPFSRQLGEFLYDSVRSEIGQELKLCRASDVDAEAQRLRGNGVRLRADVADTAWGTREFSIQDNDGHTLCFGQRVAN